MAWRNRKADPGNGVILHLQDDAPVAQVGDLVLEGHGIADHARDSFLEVAVSDADRPRLLACLGAEFVGPNA